MEHRREWDFGEVIETDGVSVNIGFIHKIAPPPSTDPPQPHDGVLGTWSPSIQDAHRIIGIDPGRINMFTAVVHSPQSAQTLTHAQPGKYSSLHWTQGNWYEASGANFRSAKVSAWLNKSHKVQRAINRTPTPRVASVQEFRHHVTHRVLHHPKVSSHFMARCYQTLRWRSYITKQQALAQMCNDIAGDCKPEHTVVAFGNASFAHKVGADHQLLPKA